MTEQLKPCPFCGGDAQRYDIDIDDPLDANDGGSGIECKSCHATSALHFERKENLVSSWNTRQAVNSYPEIREALEQIDQMPFSMVNDAESLRHTIRTIQAIARKPIGK